MKLYPERLPAQLRKQLAPVYLVAGPERLLVEEAADAIRRAAREHGVAERIRLSTEGRFDWSELGQATETASLFATRRLVELRVPSGKPGTVGGKTIRQWIDDARDDVLVILCDQWEMQQERSAWVRAVEAAGVYVPAWNVKPDKLPGWIAQRLSGRGLSADDAIVRFLAERLEGNLLAAAQEVDRLALLFPDKRLTLEAVRAAVADNARFDAFRLAELVLSGQAGAALRCARGLRESGVPEPAALWALGRELEVAQEAALEPPERVFQRHKVWQARQGPIRACVARLGARRLGNAMARLSGLDLVSKGQAEGDFWVELERFCVSLAVAPGAVARR